MTTIVTTEGLKAISNAAAGGFLVDITDFKLATTDLTQTNSDGSLKYVFGESNTDMFDSSAVVFSAPISYIETLSDGSVKFTITVPTGYPAPGETWNFTEVGLYLVTGELFVHGELIPAYPKQSDYGLQIQVIVAVANLCNVINVTVGQGCSLPATPRVNILQPPTSATETAIIVLDENINYDGSSSPSFAIRYGAGAKYWGYVGWKRVYTGVLDVVDSSTIKVIPDFAGFWALDGEIFIVQTVDSGSDGALDYLDTKVYDIGEVVIFLGFTYRCINKTIAGVLPTDPSYFVGTAGESRRMVFSGNSNTMTELDGKPFNVLTSTTQVAIWKDPDWALTSYEDQYSFTQHTEVFNISKKTNTIKLGVPVADKDAMLLHFGNIYQSEYRVADDLQTVTLSNTFQRDRTLTATYFAKKPSHRGGLIKFLRYRVYGDDVSTSLYVAGLPLDVNTPIIYSSVLQQPRVVLDTDTNSIVFDAASGAIISQTFTSNGGTTFTLPSVANAKTDLLVFIDGLLQTTSWNFGTDKSTIEFNTSIPSSSTVVVRQLTASTFGILSYTSNDDDTFVLPSFASSTAGIQVFVSSKETPDWTLSSDGLSVITNSVIDAGLEVVIVQAPETSFVAHDHTYVSNGVDSFVLPAAANGLDSLMVYVDGLLQYDSFNIGTDNLSIVFPSPVASGLEVDVKMIAPNSGALVSQIYSSKGNSVFTLSNAVANADSLFVFVDGIEQPYGWSLNAAKTSILFSGVVLPDYPVVVKRVELTLGAIKSQIYTSNGRTTYALPASAQSVDNEDSMFVFVDGLLQSSGWSFGPDKLSIVFDTHIKVGLPVSIKWLTATGVSTRKSLSSGSSVFPVADVVQSLDSLFVFIDGKLESTSWTLSADKTKIIFSDSVPDGCEVVIKQVQVGGTVLSKSQWVELVVPDVVPAQGHFKLSRYEFDGDDLTDFKLPVSVMSSEFMLVYIGNTYQSNSNFSIINNKILRLGSAAPRGSIVRVVISSGESQKRNFVLADEFKRLQDYVFSRLGNQFKKVFGVLRSTSTSTKVNLRERPSFKESILTAVNGILQSPSSFSVEEKTLTVGDGGTDVCCTLLYNKSDALSQFSVLESEAVGDGKNSKFPIPMKASDANSLLVDVGGVIQFSSHYLSTDKRNLYFVAAPPRRTKIRIWQIVPSSIAQNPIAISDVCYVSDGSTSSYKLSHTAETPDHLFVVVGGYMQRFVWHLSADGNYVEFTSQIPIGLSIFIKQIHSAL